MESKVFYLVQENNSGFFSKFVPNIGTDKLQIRLSQSSVHIYMALRKSFIEYHTAGSCL